MATKTPSKDFGTIKEYISDLGEDVVLGFCKAGVVRQDGRDAKKLRTVARDIAFKAWMETPAGKAEMAKAMSAAKAKK